MGSEDDKPEIMASSATAQAAPGGGRPPRPSPSKDDADDDDDENAERGGYEDDVEDDPEDEDEDESLEFEAAPLHLHTLRQPARLQGQRSRSRSGSRSRASSREVSPSPTHGHKGGTGSHHKHHRSGSTNLGTPAASVPGTLEEPPSHLGGVPKVQMEAPSGAASSTSGTSGPPSESGSVSDIDPDILLDKLGFEEVEPPPPHEIAQGQLASPAAWGHSSLPSVNERMSEESLDDSHAFQDLVSSLHTSLRAHALSEEILALGTLEEGEGEEENEDNDAEEGGDEGEGGGGPAHPAVQVLDDLLTKVTDPAEKEKLLKLKMRASGSDNVADAVVASVSQAAATGVVKTEIEGKGSKE